MFLKYDYFSASAWRLNLNCNFSQYAGVNTVL